MSESSVSVMRVIVAGAAKGAWMAVLIGAIGVCVGWTLALTAVTLAPGLYTAMVHQPIEQLWPLIVRYVGGLKLIVFGWVLFATFLSYWWRALR